MNVHSPPAGIHDIHACSRVQGRRLATLCTIIASGRKMWKPMHRLPFPGAYTRKRNRYVDEDSDDEDEEAAYKAGRLHGYDASVLHGWSLDDNEVSEHASLIRY